MPIVILIVIVFIGVYVMDAINAVLNAVGGWPGVIAIVVGVVVLVGVVGRNRERTAELEKLKSMPSRVRGLVEDAQNFFGEAIDSLNQAKVQFEEKRAPVFWDKIDECEKTIMQCVDKLESAHVLIEKYNDRAPTRDLTDPVQIAPLPPGAYNDTKALFAEMSDCSYQAMAVPEFGVIYEQRRQTGLVLDEQRRIRSEMQSKLNALEAKTREAIAIANDATSAAESAKQISKSARGDWF